MSPRVSSAALGPRPSPGLLLLGVLLLSTGFTFANADSEGEDQQGDLRCMCLKSTSRVHPKHVNSVEVIKAGLHCPKAEIIATLKNGVKICLDPQDNVYKKIIKKLVKS
ncbi:platelet factor 4 [Dasypus novemcinctus]|uniref:platelet factor 4 n=1 Tax=Dasypus novemcinctus TaxID=9361 RepID=UPI0003288836|nr:platelet factor 4 [Dasypus novemcinctus]